jgi:hypothetical protein
MQSTTHHKVSSETPTSTNQTPTELSANTKAGEPDPNQIDIPKETDYDEVDPDATQNGHAKCPTITLIVPADDLDCEYLSIMPAHGWNKDEPRTGGSVRSVRGICFGTSCGGRRRDHAIACLTMRQPDGRSFLLIMKRLREGQRIRWIRRIMVW